MSRLKQAFIYFVIPVLLSTFWIPLLGSDVGVHAYGQPQMRAVELSNSAVNATGVSYNVSFEPSVTTNLGGIVVDFCANDPIVNDTCSAPTAFTVGGSPTFSGLTGIGTGGTWVASSLNSGTTFVLSNATPQTPTGTSTAINFTITNVHNPSTLGTFYARFITYDTNTHATGYTATTVSNANGAIDAGGDAISTVNQVTITSKVQEVLTFCVYTSAFDSGACTGTGTTITLGNNNGVLSTLGPYVDVSTKYDIQTNALHGAVIRFNGTVPTDSPNVIESSALNGMGAAAGTAYASTTGSPQFGLCTWSAGGTTANLVPAAPYNDAGCNGTSQTAGLSGGPGGNGSANFAFNISNAGSTYGDILANVTAGTYAEGEIAFIGNISNTTVAGIYSNTLTFIATSTY